MGIIKALSRRPGFEYARRSPSVESVYRRPGLLRQESLVLFLLQFTHSQLWRCSGLLPCPLLHTPLHYPVACLESANVSLKFCRYHPVCPSLYAFLHREPEGISNTVFDFEMRTTCCGHKNDASSMKLLPDNSRNLTWQVHPFIFIQQAFVTQLFIKQSVIFYTAYP